MAALGMPLSALPPHSGRDPEVTGGRALSRKKRRGSGQSPAMLNADSPISYAYLTLETALPNLPEADQVGAQQLPPSPDLRRFGSPLAWSHARKNLILALSCIATFLSAYSAGSFSPPAGLMAADLGSSRLVVVAGIATFCLGFAVAPMALAPVSEIWGRFPVLAVTGAVFVTFQALCSIMPSAFGLLVARFLVGAGASVFSAVVGGVIADLWCKEDRNTPLALFSGSVLAGTGAGPLVATVLIHDMADPTLAWKWTFWHQAIMDAALMVALLILYRESRASVLLTTKARVLNKWHDELEAQGAYGLWVSDAESMPNTASASPGSSILDGKRVADGVSRPGRLQRIRWVVQGDKQRPAVTRMIVLSLQRPFYLLLTEPIVFCFSLWAAFSWGVLYLSFSVVYFLYDTDLNRSSRVYVAIIVAAAVATAASIAQQKLLRHPQWRAHADDEGFRYSDSRFWAFLRRRLPPESPEARLYFACVTAILLPAGLFGAFVYPSRVDGYGEAIGMGVATCGIYSVYLSTFNYLTDAYGTYASSALAAQSFCRNMLGGSFPLITGPMFTNLGLSGAGGLLGGIAIVLTIVPWLLVFFGNRIRARSNFANVGSRCKQVALVYADARLQTLQA